MLKELCCTAMLLTAGANLYAQEPQSIEKSQTIVYINGAKYYVHNVRHGETLYSLAKTYGVAEQVIAAVFSAASVLPTAFLRIKMTEPGFR